PPCSLDGHRSACTPAAEPVNGRTRRPPGHDEKPARIGRDKLSRRCPEASAGGARNAQPAVVGRLTSKRAPPSGRLSAEIVPPCRSTIHAAIASPRPVPPSGAL